MEDNKPRRCYLITHPRTASNLLVRILALDNQPNLAHHRLGAHGGYFFHPASILEIELGLRDRHVGEWTEGQRDLLREKIQECFDNFEEYLDYADKEKKIAFVKEHGVFLIEPSSRSVDCARPGNIPEQPWTVKVPPKYGFPLTRSLLNKSIFPDEFLHTLSPIFLIRHPALVFPSQYRVMRDLKVLDAELTNTSHLDFLTSFDWIRSMYDFWSNYLQTSAVQTERPKIWPIILEADDIMSKPSLVTRFCNIVGLDPTKLTYEWQADTEIAPGVLPEFVAERVLGTLKASNGIMAEKMSTYIDIGVESRKWAIEFGDVASMYLENRVRNSMPDYEYMKARRLSTQN